MLSSPNISCPSSTLCAAVDGEGFALEIDPAPSRPTWGSPTLIDPSADPDHQSIQITSVACPSISLCVAADDGKVIVGRSR